MKIPAKKEIRRRISIVTLIFLFFVVAFAPQIFIRVEAGHVGVLYYLFAGGTVTDKVYGEGLEVIAPWDSLIVYNVRKQIVNKEIDVLSKDGLSIKVQVAIRFQPVRDSVGAIHKDLGPYYVKSVLIPEVESSARKIISRYTPEEFYAIQREDIENEIVADTRAEFGPLNINVHDIMIKNIELPPIVATAIEKKLEQEQITLEYDYRLIKEDKERQRKIIEAAGIKAFKDTAGISILKWRGIEATENIAQSANSKIILIGPDDNSLPVILNAENENYESTADTVSRR